MSTTIGSPEEAVEQASALQTETIGFQLHIRMPGIRAKVDKAAVDFKGADQDWMHLSKDIIDSDDFRKIQGQARLMRAYVKAKSVPSPVLKGGVYLIPVAIVEKVQEKLDEMGAEFNELVRKFITAYGGGLVERAQERLGPLFNPADYPSVPEIRRAFGVEYAYISMETPTKLRSISRVLFEREQKRAVDRWRSLDEEVQALMRAEMKGFVDRMVNALGTKSDGKKRQFREGTLDKLVEFLDTAAFRNVANDNELQQLVDDAKALAVGVDVEAVRKDDSYRNAIHNAFDKIKSDLDQLVIEKPKRRIVIDKKDAS